MLFLLTTTVICMQSMHNLRMEGLQKIFQGMTNLKQINKVSA